MENRYKSNGNVAEFILLGSKITADGDCSHKIKRCLLLGRKGMTNLDSIFKSRDITLPTKVHLVKAMIFPVGHVWVWELDYKESWALKNYAFALWYSRRLLRIPWIARRSNQSILKISPRSSLERLTLKLNTLPAWCQELTHWKRPWCWERLRAGGEGDDGGWDD